MRLYATRMPLTCDEIWYTFKYIYTYFHTNTCIYSIHIHTNTHKLMSAQYIKRRLFHI